MAKIKVNHDFYKTLGIPDFSDALTIKKAYRTKALEHHPDRGGSDEMMQKINYIYEVLSQYKDAYDRYLRQSKYGQVVQQRPKVVIVQNWSYTSGYDSTTSTGYGTWTSF